MLTLATLFIHLVSTRTSLLPIHLIGQTGATMTAALSMTTGLLMSYRSSSALAKWGKGKAAWGGIKGEVRDVLRQVRTWRCKYRRVGHRALMRPANQLSASHPVNTNNMKGDEEEETDVQRRRRERATELDAKAGDLTCLFVAFGFALQ